MYLRNKKLNTIVQSKWNLYARLQHDFWNMLNIAVNYSAGVQVAVPSKIHDEMNVTKQRFIMKQVKILLNYLW